MKKFIIGACLILFVFLGFKKCQKEATIRKNFKVTSAMIQEVRSGYRGGLQIGYSFTYNGRKYKGETKVLISSSFENRFRNKRIPVAFDSLRPNKNDLLLLPNDFNKYALTFPDTLTWVVDLKNKSL